MALTFRLPPPGSLVTANQDDPLEHYYRPFVGKIYRDRIQIGFDLLPERKFSKILDFGYGSGLLFPSLQEMGEELHGVDLLSDPAAVQSSLKKLHLNVQLSNKNILSKEYPDEFFDLVTSFSVFEHISDPTTILTELKRIVKKNGYLLVGMPRVDAWMELLFHGIGFHSIKSRHVQSFRQFQAKVEPIFHLVAQKHLCYGLPKTLSLYYTALYQKI